MGMSQDMDREIRVMALMYVVRSIVHGHVRAN